MALAHLREPGQTIIASGTVPSEEHQHVPASDAPPAPLPTLLNGGLVRSFIRLGLGCSISVCLGLQPPSRSMYESQTILILDLLREQS